MLRVRSQISRAFTLMEVLATTTTIAVVAMIAIPAMQDDTRLRVMAASTVLASDIELAQVMTISYPETPVVVRFDPPNSTYWLAYESDPDTPITRVPTGLPYRVVGGEGRARAAAGVTMMLIDMPNNTLTFNAHGGVDDMTTSPQVQLSYGGESITLAVATTTGTISALDGAAISDDEITPGPPTDPGLPPEVSPPTPPPTGGGGISQASARSGR